MRLAFARGLSADGLYPSTCASGWCRLVEERELPDLPYRSSVQMRRCRFDGDAVNCFDCATHDHTASTAVAVCVSCGAGVCERHACMETRIVPQPASVGRHPVGHTRAVTCPGCDMVLTHKPAAVEGSPSLV
jgi:hypothetical protein